MRPPDATVLIVTRGPAGEHRACVAPEAGDDLNDRGRYFHVEYVSRSREVAGETLTVCGIHPHCRGGTTITVRSPAKERPRDDHRT